MTTFESLNTLQVIGTGVALELALFVLLRLLTRLDSRTMGTILLLAVIAIYIPFTLLFWRGGDVFAIELAIFVVLAFVLGVIGRRTSSNWHWAPAVIFLFFGVVIGTQIVFLGVAQSGIQGIFARLLPEPRTTNVADSRFPGTVPYDFQKKEALYNAYLEQVEQQQARGWQVNLGWEAQPQVGVAQRFVVLVEDRDGQPISDAEITGEFVRPSNSEHDFAFTLISESSGFYANDVLMPLPGIWRMVLRIARDDDVHEVQGTTSVALASKQQ